MKRGPPGQQGSSHENAADGLLVVQICALGTISREVPQAAPLLIGRRDGSCPNTLNREIAAGRHRRVAPVRTLARLGK